MSVSRLAQARKAVRPALKGRLLLSGVPGAGKTRTGLIIATELAQGGPILIIDTERESALTYADDFDFIHLPWHAPFDPAELTQVLHQASGQYSVVMIDSFTHFWRGEGGILDTASGKFTGWKEARPLHEALVNAVLTCDAHVLLCVRSKIGYTQVKEGGRDVVKKLGMEDQQDDNLAFEMNVGLDLALDHTATVSKSRTTALPVGRSYGVDRTVEMASTYREWLKGGEQPVDKATADAVLARLNALDGDYRRKCKAEFAGAFGRPEQLHESVLDAASEMLARFEAQNPTNEGGDDDGPGGKGSSAPEGSSHEGELPEQAAQDGTSETDDVGKPGFESSPAAAQQVSEGSGDNGVPAAPNPDAAVARLAGPPLAAGEGPPATGATGTQGGPTGGPPKPKTRRPAPKSPAEALHRQLGAMGFDPHIHGELIFAESGGTTVHASELSDGQRAMVITRAEAIEAGRYTVDQLHQICADYRADHLDGQLEASLDAQRAKAGEAAVAEFDAAVERRAS